MGVPSTELRLAAREGEGELARPLPAALVTWRLEVAAPHQEGPAQRAAGGGLCREGHGHPPDGLGGGGARSASCLREEAGGAKRGRQGGWRPFPAPEDRVRADCVPRELTQREPGPSAVPKVLVGPARGQWGGHLGLVWGARSPFNTEDNTVHGWASSGVASWIPGQPPSQALGTSCGPRGAQYALWPRSGPRKGSLHAGVRGASSPSAQDAAPSRLCCPRGEQAWS